MDKLLSQLNEAQREATINTQGPVMIIAGAGSGKTRVLTYRIAYLLSQGIDAFNVLALTFTNKAAREMKERIGKLIGTTEAKNLWMGTFHSVFARILRAEAEKLGYPSNFTIYDTEDALKVVSNIIKEKNLDKEIYKPKTVMRRISSCKNNLITPKAYLNFPELLEQDENTRMPKMHEIYRDYAERCFRSGSMDFDDLLLKTNELLATYPDVLAKYQDRFRYIMVDEYQDTNHSQYLIVKALASRFENICVVGDDAQSIYAFRGANIRNILNFQKDYSDAKIFKLEQNYRSTDNIVQAANSLIANNREQLKKDVWTQNQQGEKITVYKALNDAEEARYVAQKIFDLHMQEQSRLGEFAILYRTNAQSRSLEEALRKRNLKYRIYGGVSFYQRKEIKDMLAYFRLAINAKDEEALRRVINLPARGIGQTTMDKLTVAAEQNKSSLWEVCSNEMILSNIFARGTVQKITDFVTKVQTFQIAARDMDAFEAAERIAKGSGLITELVADKTPEGISRYENVQELMNSLKDFVEQQKKLEEGADVSLAYFLQDIALITDADNETDDAENQVALMTIHLAKGLEFPNVFIVGMEENLFPSMMMLNSRADLEEERRLFYVAITRAERKLFLTHTHMRYRWGKLVDCEPSRFIEEIDEEFVNHIIPELSSPQESKFLGGPSLDMFGGRSISQKTYKLSNTPEQFKNRKPQIQSSTPFQPKENFKRVDASGLKEKGNNEVLKDPKIGDRVFHDKFGSGNILNLEGEGANIKVTISFDKSGEKRLLLNYAKLIRIG